MYLIADSGSSKTQWCMVESATGKVVKEVFTRGLNPYHQTVEAIAQEIKRGLTGETGKLTVGNVYFYGAGCEYDKKADVHKAISMAINADAIEVESDLLAAARALFKDNAGIACILGTGSNSCLYDGQKITDNVVSLGYVLDDMGAGAALGKLFFRACFKKTLPSIIVDEFMKEYDLSIDIILDKIYKQPRAGQFLASVSPFIHRHLNLPEVAALVEENFRDFFFYNVSRYSCYKDLPVAFIGSIAYYYSDILHKTAQDCGSQVSLILQSPMQGLLQYHAENDLFYRI